MNTILRAIAPYAATAILAVVVWFQRGDIARQDAAITAYGQVIERQANDLENLGNRMTTQRLDLAQLERTQDDSQRAGPAHADLERLKNENPQVRSWADTVLPDPVARLRQRPALTGAAAYAEYLRTRDPVQSAGGGAKD